MARKIYSRIKISGVLEVKRTLHVGGIHLDSTVDLTLAVNGKGEVYIPGTSIAGALRAWIDRTFSNDKTACQLLWGFQETNKKAVRQPNEQASAIVIEDAIFQTADGKPMQPYQMEVRDGIGIDRNLGSTVENFQYTRGVIPRGSKFPLELVVDCPSEEAAREFYPMINALLSALVAGEIRMGAAKSRGLGWVELQSDFKRIEQHLHNKVGLLQALRGGGEPYAYQDSPLVGGGKITLTLTWEPIGPFMVKSEQSGVTIDILPLMGRKGRNELGFVLPGSSVKGAVRSQAERIIRTLMPSYQTVPEEFAKQIDLPLVRSLFGTSAAQKAVEENKKDQCLPGLSALSIEDCYSTQSCQPNAWREVVKMSKDVQPTPVLAGVGMGDTQQAYHVAIDRWTGGAADKMLYTALEPFGIGWEPIIMRLDFERIPESEHDAALALLLFLFRDMADRRIALGYGTNRGMGGMQLKSVEFRGAGELSDLAQRVVNQVLPNGDLAHLGKDLLISLTEAWTKWLDSQKVAQ
jgi:CRISPR/Cas system CSM-associated protein Csm3 (group 7 of RAMP superfamily)